MWGEMYIPWTPRQPKKPAEPESQVCAKTLTIVREVIEQVATPFPEIKRAFAEAFIALAEGRFVLRDHT
jgi:hypothetical protein